MKSWVFLGDEIAFRRCSWVSLDARSVPGPVSPRHAGQVISSMSLFGCVGPWEAEPVPFHGQWETFWRIPRWHTVVLSVSSVPLQDVYRLLTTHLLSYGASCSWGAQHCSPRVQEPWVASPDLAAMVPFTLTQWLWGVFPLSTAGHVECGFGVPKPVYGQRDQLCTGDTGELA